MRLLDEGEQRILVVTPELGQLVGAGVLAAGQLERHLKAIRVQVVEVLHTTFEQNSRN